NTARDWYIFHWNLEFWSGFSEERAAQMKAGEVEFKNEDGTVSKVKLMRDPYIATTTHKYFGMDDLLWNQPMTYDQIKDLPDNKQVNNFIASSPNGWAVVAGYGSARYNTAAGLQAMVYAKETGDLTFANWAKDQMEYILGDNPMGYAYEVGYEYSYASLPHHRSSHCSAKQSMEDPVNQVHTLWGALVGGPDLKDYHLDETKEYIYNEVTDDYNAAFCGDLAGLYHFFGAEGKELADKNYTIEDFNMSENAYAGYDQIDKNGDPLPTGLFVSGGKNQEQEDSVQLKVVVHNRTINPPKFESDLKARYYFNVSEVGGIGALKEPRIDYDQEKSFTDGKNEAVLTGPFKYDDNGTYYVEISWQNCDFYGSRVYQFCLGYEMDADYNKQKWDSKNDYSYADLVSFENENDAAAITDKITLYADGKLVWGVEPDGTTASEEPANSDVLWGDANVDNKVTISDAVAILQSIANKNKYALKPQGEINGDVYDNGSGITGSDASVIQMLDAGIYKQSDLPVKASK
ncbi:MAG TPA: glycoside hydrolase, partial [Ruminococcus sp.]|nr:glycoside hydrolase [Ruminococcus sp.]